MGGRQGSMSPPDSVSKRQTKFDKPLTVHPFALSRSREQDKQQQQQQQHHQSVHAHIEILALGHACNVCVCACACVCADVQVREKIAAFFDPRLKDGKGDQQNMPIPKV